PAHPRSIAAGRSLMAVLAPRRNAGERDGAQDPAAEPIGPPRPQGATVLRAGGVSIAVSRRGVAAVLGVLVLTAVLVVASLLIDAAGFGVGELLSGLLGTGDSGVQLLVRDILLPRVVCALLAGAGLGAAGCLTQTLARNRLATPDILGVSEGATTAMLAVAGA